MIRREGDSLGSKPPPSDSGPWIDALCWGLLSPDSLDWHGIAALATWLMTLFIQRAEHRDTQAIQAKLELLHAEHRARNELMKIDEREPEEIERHRECTQAGN
jgi:low affinity Fe/Cu permease